ncbi:MAG: ATP-dependent DNA ligase [Candidatus Helarchaeota archaeon]
MTEIKFAELARICEDLTKTTKINEKTRIVSEFLKKLNLNEISSAIYLIIGTIFSETDPRTLDINWKSIESILKANKQQTLLQRPLTINYVYGLFSKIAEISGTGSKRKKKELLISLFSQASFLERKFLIRNIFGEMRHGVKEGVMVKAISEASNIDYLMVKRGYMINGDIGMIGRIAIEEGINGIKNVKIKLFRPIKPMLGEILEDLNRIFTNDDKKIALEYKYDGIRVQIHKSAREIKIYTRHLKEISSNFPEIIEQIKKNIKYNNLIIEGELIAVDKNGRPLPFQELMHRFKRIYEIDKLRTLIPVKLLLFDIIYYEKKSFLEVANEKRWELLTKVSNKVALVKRIVTNSINEAKDFYESAIKDGHEGIMIKKLGSIYFPGERKKDWLKLKSEIRLNLVIVAADWGSGRRNKWLSNYHLAVVNDKGEFQIIGKTFKGITDKEFELLTSELLKIKIDEGKYTVFVKPKIVVEVAFNEIQRSSQYKSGFALRFARIKRIRADKNPEEATKLDEVVFLYKKQINQKGKSL